MEYKRSTFMIHRPFLIALGTLILMNLSSSSFGAAGEEFKENGLPTRVPKTEVKQEQRQEIR